MFICVSLKSKFKLVPENTRIRKHTCIHAHKSEYQCIHKNNTLMCVYIIHTHSYKRLRTHNTDIRAHINTRHTRISYLMHASTRVSTQTHI